MRVSEFTHTHTHKPFTYSDSHALLYMPRARMQCFYVHRYVGTIDAMRAHAKVCARRDVACPITYCAKHSKHGNPVLLLPADTIVESTRKEHSYLTYVKNTLVIAYCDAELKPPAKLPQKGVAWAFCMQASEGDDYLVECEYDPDRSSWLVGVVALNADKHEYSRANIKIGCNKYGQSRRVDISVVNKENVHLSRTMNGVQVDQTAAGISFYEDVVEDSTNTLVTTMRVSVDLLHDYEYYPPLTQTMKTTTITVQPYAIGKHALPSPRAASVHDNGAAAVPAVTSTNAAATTSRALFSANDTDDTDRTTLGGNAPPAGADDPIEVNSDDEYDSELQTTTAEAMVQEASSSSNGAANANTAMANVPSSSNSAANAAAPEMYVTPSRSNGEPGNRRTRLDSETSFNVSGLSDDDSDRSLNDALDAALAAAQRLTRSNVQVPAAQAPFTSTSALAQAPRRTFHVRYATVAEREEAKRQTRLRINAKRRQRTIERRAAAAANGTTSAFNTAWFDAVLDHHE